MKSSACGACLILSFSFSLQAFRGSAAEIEGLKRVLLLVFSLFCQLCITFKCQLYLRFALRYLMTRTQFANATVQQR